MALGKGNKGGNKGKRVINVDMTGVESGQRLPEGDYLVKVLDVESFVSENSGKPSLKWTFEVAEGENAGSKLYYNTSLQPQALFNLKGVLISLGIQVPNSSLKLNLDELIDQTCGVTVEHEVYEGKKRARIVDVFPWDGEGAEDEGEDLSEMDLAELLEYAKENDIDLSGLDKKAKKNADKVREAISAALEDDDEEEGEDDSEDEDDEEGDEVDLESMDLKELRAFAKEKEIDLSSLSKKAGRDEKKVRALIAEALEADDEDDSEDEEDDDDAEEVDLDAMDLKALVAFAKENEIELSAKSKKNEKLARQAIAKAIEEDI